MFELFVNLLIDKLVISVFNLLCTWVYQNFLLSHNFFGLPYAQDLLSLVEVEKDIVRKDSQE